MSQISASLSVHEPPQTYPALNEWAWPLVISMTNLRDPQSFMCNDLTHDFHERRLIFTFISYGLALGVAWKRGKL